MTTEGREAQARARGSGDPWACQECGGPLIRGMLASVYAVFERNKRAYLDILACQQCGAVALSLHDVAGVFPTPTH
jgi:hypothetical protein